jgi:deoxyadenosine/deoxycytidine kinase
MATNHVFIISIEGNIGSGKTTLLEKVKSEFSHDARVVILKEPVDEWNEIVDENGVNMLQKFYEDQTKYSFSFQMMAYISRLNLIKTIVDEYKSSEKTHSLVIVTERSLNTDKMVFARMLYDMGKIEHVNYQIYLKWFHAFYKDYPVNHVVYVKTDPEICHRRIASRQRDGEEGIPLEYLITCDKYHDAMLDTECNKLVLNGNIDMHENSEEYNSWMHQLTGTFAYYLYNIATV